MTRSSFWAVAALVTIASAPALACPGGMMGGGMQGGHDMHAMMHGQGQGMGHGQHMMGRACGQGGGICPMSGAAEQTSPAPSSDANTADANTAQAGHDADVKK